MGLYDTLEFNCPGCGRQLHLQTKVFDRNLRSFKIGSRVSIDDEDMRFLMYWHCDESTYVDDVSGCGARFIINVKKGIFDSVEIWNGKEEVASPDGERIDRMMKFVDELSKKYE